MSVGCPDGKVLLALADGVKVGDMKLGNFGEADGAFGRDGLLEFMKVDGVTRKFGSAVGLAVS